MKWLRLYHEVVDDPKVQRLPLSLFKFWINTLCLAGKHGGFLPAEEDIAFTLHMKQQQVRELLDRLESAGLIELKDGHLRHHNWDQRQFQSDGAGERMRRHREKHRVVTVTAPPAPPAPDVTGLDGGSDGAGDAPRVQIQNTDTENTKTLRAAKDALRIQQAQWYAAIWPDYWLHKSKADGFKAFCQHVLTEDQAGVVHRAILAQRPEMLAREAKNRPYMGSWIRGLRWNDDIAPLLGTEPLPTKQLTERELRFQKAREIVGF